MGTSSAAGRLVLNSMMAVGQWEREAIGDRTREGMSHNVAYPLTLIALDTAGHGLAAGVRGASP
jgi:hypothetical protein